MRTKAFILLFPLLFSVLSGKSQLKLIEKLMPKQDSSRSASFLPLPAIGYSQETGLELGAIVLYSFYTDRLDTLVRNSSINGLLTFTTKKQLNFYIKSDIWTKGNKNHYYSELRYKNFPFSFYGIGNGTFKSDEDKIVQKLTRISGEAERLISRNYYAGITAGFESYTFTDKEIGGIYSNSPLIQDKDGGKVLFGGISQIYDTRNTNTYTTEGTYVKVNYSYAPDLFGGENFTGSKIELDFRAFKSLAPKSVVGFNLIYNTLQGKQTPFYLLPQLGNDQMMRGYYSGRYRDENLLAAQAEFRYRFIPMLGAAVFAGAGNVYQNGGFEISDLKPSYGAGLRYFFNVERGLSVRLDYGIGEKRPGEKRQTGFYISFGEAF